MSTNSLRLIGWALFATGCLAGLSAPSLPSTASWLAAIIACFAALAWIRQDAASRGVALPFDWSWLMAISWPVSFLWYGRRSRRGWAVALGLAALPLSFPVGFLLGRIAKAIVR